MSNEWTTAEHALAYLQRADRVPHRTEGEAMLLEEVPREARRILDLGSGDGRLLGLLLLACPTARGVALDFSPPMLERLRERFGTDRRERVVSHNLEQPLPASALAVRTGISVRQLERLFQRYLGRTPRAHYVELRLQRAHRLLTHSSLSVTEVGLACGFVSASHFAKRYRERFRQTPQKTRIGPPRGPRAAA